MAQLLLVVGFSILGILGSIHLIYTFFTEKFVPFDLAVANGMKSTSPRLTKETTVWKAWIGFNASHSLGVIFFAAIYIPLTINHLTIIESSLWFSMLPIAISSCYLSLAYRYWFNVPLIGILASLVCFLAAVMVLNF